MSRSARPFVGHYSHLNIVAADGNSGVTGEPFLTALGATRGNLIAVGPDGGYPGVYIAAFGTPGSPFVQTFYYRGTGAAPAAVHAGDELGGFYMTGCFGSGYKDFNNSGAFMAASATQNWTPSANGCNLTFGVIPNNSTAPIAVLTLQASGGVSLNTAADLGRGNFNTTGSYFVNGASIFASPNLTGRPTAPTPPANDNSQAVATTAFVAAGFLPFAGGSVSSLTVNGNLTVAAAGAVLCNGRNLQRQSHRQRRYFGVWNHWLKLGLVFGQHLASQRARHLQPDRACRRRLAGRCLRQRRRLGQRVAAGFVRQHQRHWHGQRRRADGLVADRQRQCRSQWRDRHRQQPHGP
jgi:hypothetical protein